MITISILEQEVKYFMSRLFKENLFDNFQVRLVEIISFTRFKIDGLLENYTNDQISKINKSYCTWNELKPYVFNIIKGNKKPKYMKIIFSLNKEDGEKIHNNGSVFYLNMIFSNDKIVFTTATSQKNFNLDKKLDHNWEEYIINFFKINNIYYV